MPPSPIRLVLAVCEVGQEESDEAAWKEKEKEEEKSIRGSEGNSTVVSVDEVIGEADNDGTTSTKESTTIPIHPVLDMIINHLPHEVCVLFHYAMILV